MASPAELLESACAQVRAFLPTEEISDEHARLILQLYVAAIEGNFISWMGAAALTARSIQGRYAAQSNLYVELKADHAGMLRNLAKQTSSEPSWQHYRMVDIDVLEVRGMVSQMSGLYNLVLMAVLENTSIDFIPVLEKMAKQLHAYDLTYTQVHGEADAVHANQFAEALEHECREGYLNPDSDMAIAARVTVGLLESIFSRDPDGIVRKSS